MIIAAIKFEMGRQNIYGEGRRQRAEGRRGKKKGRGQKAEGKGWLLGFAADRSALTH
jgi:hypothetical protein